MRDTCVDLRSDTVTQPTETMRRAMAGAEVGDDVYGEDPTINRLEETAAELMGREAAVYVPTGTMGNQIAIHLHTSPGTVETNIVFFSLAQDLPLSATELAAQLAENGVLAHALGHDSIRMVTHYQIGDDDVERTVGVVRSVMGG